MKKKFIRVLSPITLAVITALDIAVFGFGIFALKKLFEELSAAVIFFTAIEIFAIVIGILITKEVLKNGISFYEDEMEFTGIDENNLFSYEEIEKIDCININYAIVVREIVKNEINEYTQSWVDAMQTSNYTPKLLRQSR